MHDLIESTQDVHYENYRSQKLASLVSNTPPQSNIGANVKPALDKAKDEEQLKARFTEQVRKEEQRFRLWEQKVYYNLILLVRLICLVNHGKRPLE